MCVLLEFVRRAGNQGILDCARRLAGGESRAVRYTEDVSVHGNVAVPEHDVEDDARRLAADSGKGLQRLPVRGHAAPVQLQDLPAQSDQVVRLGVEQPDRPQVLLDALNSEIDDRLWRVGHGEQLARRAVDALVGGVRREHDRDQQLERRVIFQLGLRFGVGVPQPPIDRPARG